jgi:predicted DNA-binding transcriptional regulator AlpA
MSDTPVEDRIVSMREATGLTSLSRGSILRLEGVGDFVPRVPLTEGRFGYSYVALLRWIAERKSRAA